MQDWTGQWHQRLQVPSICPLWSSADLWARLRDIRFTPFADQGRQFNVRLAPHIANSRMQIALAARISVAAKDSAYLQSYRAMAQGWDLVLATELIWIKLWPRLDKSAS
jgi:hypothetical protein